MASGVVRSDLMPLVADPGLDRADQAGQFARHRSGLPQPALDEVRGGGLAGGAGDADLEQVLARLSVDRPRRVRPSGRAGPATVSTGSPVAAARSAPAGSVSTATAPRLGGLRDEVGAVEAGARQRGVDVTGAYGTRVVGDAGRGEIPRSGARLGVQLPGQFLQRNRPYVRGPGRPRGDVCRRLGGRGGGATSLGGREAVRISLWHGGERTGRECRAAK